MLRKKDLNRSQKVAVQQTLLTHGSELCVKYSTMLAEELYTGKAIEKYSKYKLANSINREEVMSGGFVKETYEVKRGGLF